MTEIGRIDRPVTGGNQQMGWVSDVAAEMLRRLGIKYVALNPGASYRGFHDSIVNYLGNQDPQMLLCLHEDHAVSIAHGYSKVTDEPMACVLHSNVGLMHGLMNLFNAWCDRRPMLVMGATGPVDSELRRPWIDWIHTAKDQGALLRNFTKWDDEPRSAAALMESMLRAVMTTKTAPQGPVYICLDAGLQETELAEPLRIPDVSRFKAPEDPRAADTDVEQAAELLINAKNPVIMMGRTSRKMEDWENRIKLAEMIGGVVFTSMKDPAAFPTDHGLHPHPPAGQRSQELCDALKTADVVLALDWVDLGGTFRLAGPKDFIKAKVINVTLDSYLHNGWSMDYFALAPADLRILATPDAFTAQLLPAIEKRLGGGRRKWDGKSKRGARPAAPDKKDGDKIGPRDIGIALGKAKGNREICLAHVTIGWDPASYDFRHPLDYLGHDGGGGLGHSPGGAIGTALALQGTGRIPVSVMGDGDFLQGGTALWTAAHYKIPMLIMISNNRSNFNDEIHQETMAKQRRRPVENRWIGQRIDDPAVDLAGFAKSQGIAGIGPVKTIGELAQAIEKGLKMVEAGEPCLIDVHVEPGYSQSLMTRASGEGSKG
jgi:thiamine pyrophosphate-dependent acetolactate synthase large subunit-like protein